MAAKRNTTSMSSIITVVIFFVVVGILAFVMLYFRQINLDTRNRAAVETSPYLVQNYLTGFQLPNKMASFGIDRIFVLDKSGTVRLVKSGVLQSVPYMNRPADLGANGLFGIALDPSFTSNGFIYVYYGTNTTPPVNKVVRLTPSSTNGDVADESKTVTIINNLLSSVTTSTGGSIAIGPDNKLYVPVGVGANAASTSQDLNTVLGKVLRYNLDGTIPADNPFVGQSGARGEIWAYGFKNPFSMKAGEGRIFVNDSGSAAGEEINELVKGGNYGHGICDGVCTNASIQNPLFVYTAIDGSSISTGVFAYGDYYFADYTGGWIKKINLTTKSVETVYEGLLGPIDMQMVAPNAINVLLAREGSIKRLIIPQPTATPTLTPTAIPTNSPTPTRVPTATPLPTAIPTNTPTPTRVPTVTPTRTPTPTAIPTNTPTATMRPTNTATPTLVPSATPTRVPTLVPSATPTLVPTATPTQPPFITNPPGWWWLIPEPLRDFLEQLYVWVFFFRQPSSMRNILDGIPTPTP